MLLLLSNDILIEGVDAKEGWSEGGGESGGVGGFVGGLGLFGLGFRKQKCHDNLIDMQLFDQRRKVTDWGLVKMSVLGRKKLDGG